MNLAINVFLIFKLGCNNCSYQVTIFKAGLISKNKAGVVVSVLLEIRRLLRRHRFMRRKLLLFRHGRSDDF